jgi:hypothetical protein
MPFTPISREPCCGLPCIKIDYGLNMEPQMKSARVGLGILELPVPYRCRAGGNSKVAGSLRGSTGAGWRIVVMIFWIVTTGAKRT